MSNKKQGCVMTQRISDSELYDIEKKIEISRENLYSLIDRDYKFTDKTIVLESQKLDKLLNKYEELKKVIQ